MNSDRITRIDYGNLLKRLFLLVIIGFLMVFFLCRIPGYQRETKPVYIPYQNIHSIPAEVPTPEEGFRVFESWASAGAYLKERHIRCLYLDDMKIDFNKSLEGNFCEMQNQFVDECQKDSFDKDFEITLYQEWQKAGLIVCQRPDAQAIVCTEIWWRIYVKKYLIFIDGYILAKSTSYVRNAKTGKLLLIVSENETHRLG